MRPFRRFAALALVALCTIILFAPARADAVTLAEQRQLLTRELTDPGFFWTMYAGRTRSPYSSFDWSTDLCSSSPNNPLGFPFSGACRRHDFGYRNTKALGLWSSTTKATIDNGFLADLRAVCAGYSTVLRTTCNALAQTYYQAVRAFG